ncbi:MAG: CBS domain-containing protein [Syntrophomonadaceae bacterium]|nr:CBS domain-containing protein [Syntrophomonadaceae bacterium]MDD3024453.1 CBS domain-containing protein [Syntrophomonadaceae bacterium]
MDIITSHNSLDFDGLASMVAANKIYPGAVKVFSGTLSKNVKQFMALYKDLLLIKQAKEIDLKSIKRMIVVDTANANRLGYLKEIVLQPGIDFHIYDHHPSASDDLQGSISEIHKLGAATTILIEEIMKKGVSISPFDATILALGIYEDTGNLLFASTTSRDVMAVSYLLERGANLSVVANFMEQPFSSEQRWLLQSLLNNAHHYRIKNVDIVLAQSQNEDFVPGLDSVSFRLLEVENADAVFVIAKMQGKLNIVGRSRCNNVKINEILKTLGGRGHERAASAIVKKGNSEDVAKIILEGLGEQVQPGLLAKDIMSSPVKSIPMDRSMEEAGRIMLRYGHTGMPVVEGDVMVGMISRRDVGKARTHDLGHAPVKGFMTAGVLAVTADTPVGEIQRMMVEYDIGRLPVTDHDRLVGIVSRTDILRTLHGEDYPEDHELLFTSDGDKKENCLAMMQERMPSKILSILTLVGELAESMGITVYCVGGFVRDFFLRVPNYDLDMVVEGDGEGLARKVAETMGGKERIHQRFGTAMVALPDGTKLDIATARTEYYEFPAALPRVEKSSIREDMYRRDFTINTLALCLNPGRFGDLIDYFGGRKDIENGYIRILYNLSFIEDPTRILRAIRFEQRYQFTMEPDTLRFARDAIERRLLGKLSYKRILQELLLLLSEKDPLPALNRIFEIGVWEYILPEVDLTLISRTTLKRVPILVGWWEERFYGQKIKSWLVYIIVILSALNEQEREQVIERYHLDNYSRKSIQESLAVARLTQDLYINRQLQNSDIDSRISNWNSESIIYLLLAIKDERVWEKIVKYLDMKDTMKIDINGHELKKLGLKQGPIYRLILEELYRLKLNQVIVNREDELSTVKKWVEEGKFSDAAINN